MPSSVVRTNRPTVFTTNLKTATLSNRFDGVSIQNQEANNIGKTGSFRYDQIGAALKSTQELNIDYTSFENHTFFNSAVAKVNVAFDRIINNYPFDSSLTDIENFEDSLTGILDPSDNNFSFEMFIYPAAEANNNQIILQKRKDASNAITIALSQSAASSECSAIFAVSNNSLYATASAVVQKGAFSHLYFEYRSEDSTGSLKIYNNLQRASLETDFVDFGNITFNNASMTIGTGSSHAVGSYIFTPQENLSGALDELRFYHNTVDYETLSYNWKKEIYAKPDLKLYFKFNEPTGSYGANDVVLDYSGNSLHSFIDNFG